MIITGYSLVEGESLIRSNRLSTMKLLLTPREFIAQYKHSFVITHCFTFFKTVQCLPLKNKDILNTCLSAGSEKF